MKILICDSLNSKVLEELQSLGECIDISSSKSNDQDLVLEINDAEVVVIRSSTQLTKEIIEKGDKLKIIARCGVGIANIDVDIVAANCKQFGYRYTIIEPDQLVIPPTL